MSEKFYVDENGRFIGTFVSLLKDDKEHKPAIPAGAIEVTSRPDSGDDIWSFDAARWTEDPRAYVKKRRQEYPEIGDQLDAIMKWLATETEITVPAELKSIAMKCMSVKAQYPKPEGKE